VNFAGGVSTGAPADDNPQAGIWARCCRIVAAFGHHDGPRPSQRTGQKQALIPLDQRQVGKQSGSHIMAKLTGGAVLAAAALAGVFGVASAAFAVQPDPAEGDKLKACEKAICTIATKKEAAGSDLSCALGKTWTKDQIKSGIEKKKVSWSLGDAQCNLDVKLSRAALIDALNKPDAVVEFGSHVVKCVVDREGKETPISITMAPKITFKGGQAVTASLGIKEIDAPSVVKGAIWTAATLEDNVGLFHSDILKNVNNFLGPNCTRVMTE
jgi:hypothetical protein